MATGTSIILRGLQSIGEKELGATLSATEQTNWLAVLNTMIDSWSLERLMVYQLLEESLALTVSVGSYTIGSGGAFNTTRPTKIVEPCFTKDASNNKYALTLIDAVQYGRQNVDTTGNSFPTALFYDGADVAGLGTIYLFPKPLSGLTLYINSWKQVPQFATIGATMVLPPGYELALQSNFAIHASAGKRTVPAEVVLLARESKAAIKRINAPSGILGLPAGVSGRQRSNILTG